MKDDVLNPLFWEDRLSRAGARSEPHRAVFDCSPEDWEYIQRKHRIVIHKMMDEPRQIRLLDVGCGLGDLVEILPENVMYVGIDLCQRLVDEAHDRHPTHTFVVGDMRELPYENREFDWVVMRSVEGMVKTNLGFAAWREIEAESLRVCSYLLLLNYSKPGIYRVVDAAPDPEVGSTIRIECEGGRLTYRVGMDGCHELFDLWVDENVRMRGIGRSLVRRLEERTFGSVYGFTRVENEGAQRFYRHCGYTLLMVPRLYRGQDGYMFVKECLRDAREI